MAAYAALVSLMNNMEQIQNHPRLSTSLDKKQIESLGLKLGFFLDFIEIYNSHGGSKEVEDLESQIASAAHAAEDVIESHIVDQIHAGLTEESCSFLPDLKKIMQDMESIEEKVKKVKEEGKDQQPTYSTTAASSRPPATGKTTMVGFEGELIQLLERLAGQESRLQIIPISGMGGIGKTTLAQNVYENPLVVEHFDVRVWVTITQEYSVREILSQALSCLKESAGEMTEEELGEQLYKTLSGMRYLIILDDMWNSEAWNKIKFFFPDNGNRSRIIVTTRLSDVANNFGSLGLTLNFLDEDESWVLFCEKAFAQECCPPELEKIGKKIVKKCKGLPLSIVVLGGLLRKSSRTQEYWKKIAKDMNSVLNSGEDNQHVNIFSLSYSHLPACLKPCFLYFGIFPEDDEIRVSRLIKLWVAEGFLKPNKDQNLEEVAESYVKDLVDRNLILIRSLRYNGRYRTCGIHDSLRDLCIKVAEKENIFWVRKALDTPHDTDRVRRIIFHEIFVKKNERVAEESLARTLISKIVRWFTLTLEPVSSDAYCDSLEDTFQQVNLRLLVFESSGCPPGFIDNYKLPLSISQIWNLQTLIFNSSVQNVDAPPEIWEMRQLRHLKCNLITLPDPPPSGEKDDSILLNLRTLARVVNFECSEEVCKRMPNIKKLCLLYDNSLGEDERNSFCSSLINVGSIENLESLSYEFGYGVSNRDDLLQNLKFPSSLKKLALSGCALHWEDLTIIGLLPHLEVLQLGYRSVEGPNWNPVEGEFLHLKYLEIGGSTSPFFDEDGSTNLIYWNAESSHFPVLEKLVLKNLDKLDEIPSGIGEIPTLRFIYLMGCSVSATISAHMILEEQKDLGSSYDTRGTKRPRE